MKIIIDKNLLEYCYRVQPHVLIYFYFNFYRASFFVREFLPDKCMEVETSPDKMIDPNYVDKFTKKKNSADGFQARVY